MITEHERAGTAHINVEPPSPKNANQETTSPQAALVPYVSTDPLERAKVWAQLPPDDRRRRAMAACQHHDVPTLLLIAEAWTTLHGTAGATVSPLTRKRYHQATQALLAHWSQENLLRPARDAGVLWLRHLEVAGQRDAEGLPVGLTPSSVRVHLAAARAFYKALRWTGATEADPFSGARPARDPTPAWDKREPYTPEEIAALLDGSDGETRVLLLLGAHGGLRVAECLALRWAEVALPQRQLTVLKGKGGRRRRVPLSQTLIRALDSLRRTQEPGTLYVLPYRSDFPARQRVKALARAVGVPYKGIHALRHACGTRLVREGASLETAARLLGHTHIETTRVYAKWSDDSVPTSLSGW
jgi:integrase/recombinase XerC